MEILDKYTSIVIDYSILREFGGSRVYNELLDCLISQNKAVYVSRGFKLLHYCVLHQADVKYSYSANTMKDFCTMLLQNNQLHLVQATSTSDFLESVSECENCCVLLTANSILAKRIIEIKPSYNGDICIMEADELIEYHGVDDYCNNYPSKTISPLASINKYLDAAVYCNVGDTVMTDDNKPLQLTKRISSGAEGMVFNTDNPKFVAKIYHRGVITPLRWSKLKKMVSMGINSVGICWPHNLLFYKGVPVGYTMIIGKGSTLGNVFDGPDAIVNRFPNWKKIDVLNTLVDLLEKYLYLHMHDIIAGDIQMKNALLHSASSVYLIDMDSVQVGNMPCPVGTEEFTDPNLWGHNFSDFLRTLRDEDYSIAMLVFSLLFCGLHPYATRHGAETLREEILNRNFPYSIDNSDDEHIPLGGYNYIWEYLPDNLRNMLYASFRMGEKYEAIVWYEACVEYRDNLAAHKYEDEEAYKIFPKMDYKPAPKTVQTNEEAPKTYRNKFAINSSAVYQPSLNLGPNNSANNNQNRTNSVFVPKATGNVPTSNKPQINNDNDKTQTGLFKKFRRGLFN